MQLSSSEQCRVCIALSKRIDYHMQIIACARTCSGKRRQAENFGVIETPLTTSDFYEDKCNCLPFSFPLYQAVTTFSVPTVKSDWYLGVCDVWGLIRRRYE
ncbi:unnamed protein product [Citrullus colocynthis]|uniref:Uncharacterized protein n=1 Tax=Citrullus colocynthis TaxID=252529 RepID=A0ABP0YIF6_9ROSI